MTGPLGVMGESRSQGAMLPPSIEGFTILKPLGVGPSGQTWHAHTRTGRAVALKLLSPRLTATPGFITRFEKESAPLAVLRHAGIAELVDRGRSGAQFYLATELIPGGSLRTRLREPVEQRTALKLALEASRALHHAHMRGVLHRGLKPENLLLLPTSGVKVVDFGLARLREDEKYNPSHYTAPEQRTGATYADSRTDLFALAAILYEWLYGAQPPRPWSSAASKVPVRDAELLSLFSQSLAEAPEQRFGRMRDFSDALERILGEALAPPTPAKSPVAAVGPISFEVQRKVIHIRVRTRGDGEWLQRALLPLEHQLQQRGPWALAYDLTAMDGWNSREVDAIIELHRRYAKNLHRIGFCSPFAAVRGGGVLAGTAVKTLPWKTFSALKAMQEWLEGGLTP